MDSSPKATPETALTQVLIAFGHGVGGLLISHGAARAGLERFRPVVEKNIDEWDAHFLSLMTHATLIGRVTAHYTTTRGSDLVTVRDLLEALKLIEDERARIGFGHCPFFHH
jgi:hypothetical protein